LKFRTAIHFLKQRSVEAKFGLEPVQVQFHRRNKFSKIELSWLNSTKNPSKFELSRLKLKMFENSV